MNKRSIHPSFGPQIRALRQKKDFTIREAAELLGISNGYLANIENGIRGVPTVPTIAKMAAVYGVDLKIMMQIAGMEGTFSSSTSTLNLERLNWAFRAVCDDPSFRCGAFLKKANLPEIVKLAFVEMYMQTSERTILTPAEFSAGLELLSVEVSTSFSSEPIIEGKRRIKVPLPIDSQDDSVAQSVKETEYFRTGEPVIEGTRHIKVPPVDSPSKNDEEN